MRRRRRSRSRTLGGRSAGPAPAAVYKPRASRPAAAAVGSLLTGTPESSGRDDWPDTCLWDSYAAVTGCTGRRGHGAGALPPVTVHTELAVPAARRGRSNGHGRQHVTAGRISIFIVIVGRSVSPNHWLRR